MPAPVRPFVAIWRFTVKPDARDAFVAAYAPGGAWARLFQRSTEYLGTELVSVAADGRTFVTIDRWTSAAAYWAFRDANAAEYRALDDACAGWTDHEEYVAEGEALER